MGRNKKTNVLWTEEMIVDLKTMPKFEFMKKHQLSSNDRYSKMVELNVSAGTGFGLRSKIGAAISPEALAILGTDTDVAIAQRLGVSNQTVKRYRIAHGIPIFRGELNLETLIAQKSPLLLKAKGYFMKKFSDNGIPISEMSDRDVVKNVMIYFCKKIDDGEI